MAYNVKLLKDSVNSTGVRLTTFEVTFPRIVLAEFNTHRVFSRNSASSRAIPVEKKIEALDRDPFVPEAFGMNQKGMQASSNLSGSDDDRARFLWNKARQDEIYYARELAKIKVHKQLANRRIEADSWQTCIVSSTEWDNFFALRDHVDAQPEIKKPASMMRALYESSEPSFCTSWHLPLTDDFDDLVNSWSIGELRPNEDLWVVLAKISAGRCARVSYLTHDGKRDPHADIELCERLFMNGHMSPLEHVARPMTVKDVAENVSKLSGLTVIDESDVDLRQHFSGNFRGWVQYRKLIPHEDNFMKATESRKQ